MDNIDKIVVIILNSPEEHIIEQIKKLLIGQSYTTQSKASTKSVLSFPPLEMNLIPYRVHIDDQEIIMTRTEFEILVRLASIPCMVFTYEQLYSLIWENEATGNVNKILSYHIRRLRQKLINATAPFYIMKGMKKEHF